MLIKEASRLHLKKRSLITAVFKAFGKLPDRRELLTICNMSIARQSTTFFKRLVGKGKCKCPRLPVCYAHALIANTGDFHKARQSYCSSQQKNKFVLSEWLRREPAERGALPLV